MARFCFHLQQVLLLLFFSSASSVVIAQHKIDDSFFRAFSGKQQSAPYYFIVRTKQTFDERTAVTRRLDDSTAIVSSVQIHLIPTSAISVIFPANNNWKLSGVQLLNEIKNDQQKIIISATDLSQLLGVLKTGFPTIPVLHIDTASRSVLVKAGKQTVQQLLTEHVITFIDLQRKPTTEIGIIGYDPGFHGINTVTYTMPDANGNGIIVGVKEQRMEPEDLDLYKRIIPSPLAAEQVSNHATVISSIIGGAGNSFYDGLGIANGCSFFPSTFSNLFADDINVLRNAGVTVQNHSYGTIVQQFYGAEALSYDAQISGSNIVHIFSAGNQGRASASEGRYANIPGYANLTGNFKMAKNVISVAAIDNKGDIAAESSSGPIYDGRLAPQLTALGPNGTSDAAAVVTGTVAVLQQLYSDSNHLEVPPSSLLKSILYTTADDIYRPGIDYKTGYGLLNSYKAIKLLQQKRYFNVVPGGENEWTANITVPVNAAQLKITLSWNDIAAALNNNRALINDLDLEVIEINTGRSFQPWILNSYPQKDSLEQPAVRGRDSLNTAEQVSIRLPAAGTYQLKVRSFNQAAISMPFSIAYWVDTLQSFRFISPLHAADINREENPELNIRWAAEPADSTETGILYIDYNQANNWNEIATVKLKDGLYRWPIPVLSSAARLKMVTNNKEHISGDFIIAKLTRPKPDFVCTDSFRLSWNKHIYAASYELYALTGEPYLKKVLTTTDTFIVVNRKKNPSLVYAVQPVLTNHLPAARSIAMNIELQGVQCFYRALNYVLEDGNKIKMTLELSSAVYADSIYFERVTGTGALLGIFDAQRSTEGQFVYTAMSDPLMAGTIYIRARIRLKNGSDVYTDILPVFTSGVKNILFFPNPVLPSTPLQYVIKQGISPDCRLQVYNANGVLVKDYVSLPRTLDVSFLVKGIYLFKVTGRGGEVVATEKVIIP